MNFEDKKNVEEIFDYLIESLETFPQEETRVQDLAILMKFGVRVTSDLEYKGKFTKSELKTIFQRNLMGKHRDAQWHLENEEWYPKPETE